MIAIVYSDGLSVVEGEEFFVVLEFRFTYDGGHRRVSAVSFFLPFDLVSRMVVEEWLILGVQEWNGGQPRLCLRGTKCSGQSFSV